jgi:hypothetical protein
MNSLLTFDLLLVLVILGLLILTVSCVVLERPPIPLRYYSNRRKHQSRVTVEDEEEQDVHLRLSGAVEPIQL